MAVTNHRKFAPRVVSLADEWREAAVSSCDWRLGERVARECESEAREITRYDGLQGVAKPAFQVSTNLPRAVHEMIAAELGELLGLPIPPVTLWSDPESVENYCISAHPFRQFLEWSVAKHMVSEEFKKNMMPVLATAHVFYTWIEDRDHWTNDNNLLINTESSGAEPGLALIDHSYSMTYSWKDRNNVCVPYKGCFVAMDSLPQDIVAESVQTAQNVDSETIRQIVNRVPRLYLPEEDAKLIEERLIQRQAQLAKAFGMAAGG